MREKEKMLQGLPYDPSDEELKNGRLRARKLTRLFNNTIETELDERKKILKDLLGSTGENFI